MRLLSASGQHYRAIATYETGSNTSLNLEGRHKAAFPRVSLASPLRWVPGPCVFCRSLHCSREGVVTMPHALAKNQPRDDASSTPRIDDRIQRTGGPFLWINDSAKAPRFCPFEIPENLSQVQNSYVSRTQL
jgi:hypothetical protein